MFVYLGEITGLSLNLSRFSELLSREEDFFSHTIYTNYNSLMTIQ